MPLCGGKMPALPAFTPMPEAGAQAVMTWTVPKSLEERSDALWKSHAEMIKKTHTNNGPNELIFYHVCKGRAAEDVSAPTKCLTWSEDKITYTIVEFYRNKEGLEQHFDFFYSGVWEDGSKIAEMMGEGAVWSGYMFQETFLSAGPAEFAVKQPEEALAKCTPEIRAMWKPEEAKEAKEEAGPAEE